MSEGGGYGVDPSQITKVGGAFKNEGDAIVKLQSKAQTSIGASQVGQKYSSIASPYQQVFQQFSQILENMGNLVVETGGSLNSVADNYSQTEQSNAQSLGSA
jgi:uncharacterized protein YukE